MTTATIKTQRVVDGFHSWVEVYLDGNICSAMSLGGITHPNEQLSYEAAMKLNPILQRWGGINVRTVLTIQTLCRAVPAVTDQDLYEQEIILLKGWCEGEPRLKPLTAQGLANRIYTLAKKYNKPEHEVIHDLLKSL